MQERQTRWFNTDFHFCRAALAASPQQSPHGLAVTGPPTARPTASPEARMDPAFCRPCAHCPRDSRFRVQNGGEGKTQPLKLNITVRILPWPSPL